MNDKVSMIENPRLASQKLTFSMLRKVSGGFMLCDGLNGDCKTFTDDCKTFVGSCSSFTGSCTGFKNP